MISYPEPTLSPTLAYMLEQRKPASVTIPQTLNADEATAVCLSLIGDCTTNALPADAFKKLAECNRALLDEPRETIVKALGRQILILEAASIRFQTRAAIAKRIDDADALAKMSDRCTQTLIKALGAAYQMHKDELDV